jgi:hypothetical protein
MALITSRLAFSRLYSVKPIVRRSAAQRGVRARDRWRRRRWRAATGRRCKTRRSAGATSVAQAIRRLSKSREAAKDAEVVFLCDPSGSRGARTNRGRRAVGGWVQHAVVMMQDMAADHSALRVVRQL